MLRLLFSIFHQSTKTIMFKHELGLEATDQITGFKGIITSRIQYITGCNQYGLTPKVDAQGLTKEVQYFDEGRVQITGPGIHKDSVSAPQPGGPNRDAPKR